MCTSVVLYAYQSAHPACPGRGRCSTRGKRVAPAAEDWYAHKVSGTSGIGGGTAGPWYRVLAITPGGNGRGSAEQDYVEILPAALNAATHRRPFIAGWLSRGGGAPLELITNAGPLPAAAPAGSAGRHHGIAGRADGRATAELLFPAGGRGMPMADDWLADLDQLVWAACPARQAPPLAGGHDQRGSSRGQAQHEQGQRGSQRADAGDGHVPLFESTLTSLMARPFGWLVVAEPTDLIDAEIAELRTQLNVLRRYEEERARLDVERSERRLAELDAFREAGLWNVRVLAGAASEQELSLLAPVLVGSVGLGCHPYRLRSGEGVHELADALVVKLADERDGAQVPFAATAGVLAALTGLPRGEVPGVRLLDPGYFDVTSETPAAAGVDLGEILDGQDRPVGRFLVPLGTLNRQATDGPAHAGAAHPGGNPVAGDRAGQVRVRRDGGADCRVRPGNGDQPVGSRRHPDVGESAGPGARLPGAGAHRHGAGALPGGLRRRRAISADHVAGPAAGLPCVRLGRDHRRWRAGGGGRSGHPDAGAAAASRARGDRRCRLRPGAAGRRPRFRRRPAAFAADRLGRKVLRGRASGRHRRAAQPQRGARDRGRGQRRGQGIPDRHPDHQDRRVPAAAGPPRGPRPRGPRRRGRRR